MKELLLSYVKMLKAGFFYKTFLYSFVLIIPSIVKPLFHVSNDLYEISFIILVGFIFISFGIKEMSEKRYTFFLTLPIKTKDIIKFAYIHTYVMYILGFLGTVFVSIVSHQQVPMLYLLIIVLYLLFTNLFYPTLASYQFKLPDDAKDYTGYDLLPLLMSFIALCFYIVNWAVGPNNALKCEVLEIIVVSLLVALTLKTSYKSTLMKVTGS